MSQNEVERTQKYYKNVNYLNKIWGKSFYVTTYVNKGNQMLSKGKSLQIRNISKLITINPKIREYERKFIFSA